MVPGAFKELIRFITVRAFTRQHQASYGDSALIRPFENRIQPVDMILDVYKRQIWGTRVKRYSAFTCGYLS